MDEPTSGLDATLSVQVITSLKEFSRLGVTIAAVVHQPRYSLFSLFDEVLFIGMGGKSVFMGPTDCALPYFESLGFNRPPFENPADFVSCSNQYFNLQSILTT